MNVNQIMRNALDIDCEAVARDICQNICKTIVEFRRRGAVVAISGGVDSAVCAALAVRAVGAEKVFGLLLPEKESSASSETRALALAAKLGIQPVTQDITPVLEAIGCYQWRDEAIKRTVPEYGAGWRSKIAIGGGINGQFNYFNLVVQSPAGDIVEQRLSHREYLQIVAATNYKQRVRKTIEYFHADRLNYAVIGTPNRLEYDQGFFVKNGDGAADIKPIAHLYKTQVYALAQHLGVPEEICSATPTSDTYSMPQTQDNFYFALPYPKLDLALWAYNHRLPAAAVADVLGISPAEAERVYADIVAKRRATRYLHERPILFSAVEGIHAA